MYARARGNTTVTIFGQTFGNGSDITRVYLCGVPAAAILSQSTTHVTVLSAPLLSLPVVGFNVLTVSTLYGNGTSASGTFHYAVPNCMTVYS